MFVLLASSIILSTAGVPAGTPFPVSCAYISKNGLQTAPHCAREVRGDIRLSPTAVQTLRYEAGLASINILQRGWFYRRRDGRMVGMLTYDNGPDPFSEGLARARINGRLVYVDRRLGVRLSTPYSFGEPFRHGRARVCSGCVEQRTDGGEHAVMVGRRWAVINRRGREVAQGPS